MSESFARFLATRRSVKPDKLVAPGPDRDQLDEILTTAVRVPDHKKQAPWRLMIFEGDARAAAGEVFAEACLREDDSTASDVRLEMERQRFVRAPLVIAVISSLTQKRAVPEWEQILSAGALCYNLCLAANVRGFASNWITEWIAYSPYVRERFGLGEHERIAGFVYLGTAGETPSERERPELGDVVSYGLPAQTGQ